MRMMIQAIARVTSNVGLEEGDHSARAGKLPLSDPPVELETGERPP